MNAVTREGRQSRDEWIEADGLEFDLNQNAGPPSVMIDGRGVRSPDAATPSGRFMLAFTQGIRVAAEGRKGDSLSRCHL
jgi:hypothetical protein